HDPLIPGDPGGDVVDGTVIGKQVIVEVAIGIAVLFEGAADRVVLDNATAPNADQHDIFGAFDRIAPRLVHDGIIMVVNLPDAGLHIESTGAGGRGDPDVVVDNIDSVNHVVGQPTIGLQVL